MSESTHGPAEPVDLESFDVDPVCGSRLPKVLPLPESVLDAFEHPSEAARKHLGWKERRELDGIAGAPGFGERQSELFPDAHERPLRVIVTAEGKLRFIWDDVLKPFCELGTAYVRRASHVEPWPGGKWIADLTPSDGPLLGPFELHGEALAAEREWLEQNRGL